MTSHQAKTAPGDLGWALGILLRHWHVEVEARLAELSVTAREFQILTVVANDAPATQAALASHLGIDRTAMTYKIDDLVEAGLLERRQDPTDRRARRLVLTGAGHDLLQEIQRRVSEVEDAMLVMLSPDERGHLRRLLTRTAAHLHASDPGANCETVSRLLSDE